MANKLHWIVAIRPFAKHDNWSAVAAFSLSCNASHYAEGYDTIDCVIFSFENEYGWISSLENCGKLLEINTHFDSTLRPRIELGAYI